MSDQPDYSRLHARALVKIDYERKRAEAAEAKLARYAAVVRAARELEGFAPVATGTDIRQLHRNLTAALATALATLDKEKE